MQNKKLKVVRVVTASYVVPWHLDNTLKRVGPDFEVCVVGQDVSRYQADYPNIQWFDIQLHRKISPLDDLISFFQLLFFFKRYKPDIVHSIMPKAGLFSAIAGLLCRVPIRIHTFTGQVWVANRSKSKWLFYLFDWLINSINTLCLTDSPSQSRFLFDYGIKHADKPLPVLAYGSLSGVNLNRFDPALMQAASKQLAHQLGIGKDSFVFAFIARKTREKGAIDIIHAFAQLIQQYPKCLLLYAGPDESNGELDALKQNSPDLFRNVLSIGQVEHHEHYLALTDVLCLPSYREGFGTIVIDAAALGKPTIGSNIVGLVDAIENNKTGVLFPAGNVDALADAMRSFLMNPSQLKSMGLAARQRVEQCFSADRLYKELKSLYFNLYSNRLS